MKIIIVIAGAWEPGVNSLASRGEGRFWRRENAFSALRRRQLSAIMTETNGHKPIHPPLRTDTDALRLLILQPKVKRDKGTPLKGNPPNGDKGHDDVGRKPQAREKNGKRGSSKKNQDDDDVCGELVSSTFADKPVYECLSYTWGDQPANKRITINGQKFLIRKNLFNALRNLRQKTPRSLWVDAICINQEDVDERNSQVGLMAFIYRRATRAVVWLGLSPKPYTSIDREVMYIQNEENGEAIITNPYWSRLWIIQEIVLAQEVHFVHGNLEFEWEEVDQLLAHSLFWNTLEERIRPLIEHRDRRAIDVYRLESLLDKFRNAQCRDKRDKIFGFLGLAHDGEDEEIEVDYSIGLFELYQKLVDFHQKSQPLQPEDPIMFDIRPELDRSIRLVKFSSLVQSVFEDGLEAEARTNCFNDVPRRYYYARGAIAGDIMYIGPTYSQIISSHRANKKWKKAIEVEYKSANREALEEIRGYDLVYSREILHWDEAKLAKIRDIRSETSFGFQYAAGEDDILSDETEAIPQAAAKEQLPEPRLFIATNSRIGFAPPGARVGDRICNFFDCDIAVVVRKLGDAWTDRFRIIGKADLSCLGFNEEHEENEQKIDTDALNCSVSEFSWIEEALTDPVYNQMMNLKMDIETLQKLTC